MREPLSKRTKSRSLSKAVARGARSGVSTSKKIVAAAKTKKKSAVAKTTKSRAAKKSPLKAAKPALKQAKSAKRLKVVKPAKKAAAKSEAAKPKTALAKKAAPKISASKLSASKLSAKGRHKVAKTPIRPVAPPVSLPPEPVRRQVSSGVLRAFEHAVKVFNRRQFEEAKELFENIHHRFPQEVEINARAQTYIQICNQKITPTNASPRDADELYDRGVFALNIGDFMQARSLFEKALRLRPDEPHLLYSLAATHAQTGALDQALDYLHRSIQVQPRYRAQAMNDADFSELHEDKRFLEILGVSSPFDMLEARR
jgi:tetratricopeptide (TPR) repeat protein